MHTKIANLEVVRFLKSIGVDTRFISIYDGYLFVNNPRFSRLSRKRQETLERRFPELVVQRSKIFQKICTRASRILANSINPGERIFISEDENCLTFALKVVLEPYTRKYGVKISYGDDFKDAVISNVNSVVLPLTLDDEAEKIMGNVLNGEKIEPLNLKNEKDNIKLIYPFLNIPRSWINSWIQLSHLKMDCSQEDKGESFQTDLIKFFEEFIPDVRENIFKSAVYVSEECVQDDK
jgi:TRAP-type C4-dicarboxylate transport system substrate-binding protein